MYLGLKVLYCIMKGVLEIFVPTFFFSICKADQVKAVADSPMFDHV